MTPPRVAIARRGASLPTELSPFVLADGRGTPRFPTRVDICWDDDGLLVEFACADLDAWGTFTERDEPLWQQEVVELFLAAGEEVPASYFEFTLTPK